MFVPSFCKPNSNTDIKTQKLICKTLTKRFFENNSFYDFNMFLKPVIKSSFLPVFSDKTICKLAGDLKITKAQVCYGVRIDAYNKRIKNVFRHFDNKAEAVEKTFYRRH